MQDVLANALDADARIWFSIGLGAAFLVTMLCIVVFMLKSNIDHGFLGLILLLSIVLYMVAFSLLVAASTIGIEVKVMVGVIDVFVLIAGRLLSERFLTYLES